MRLVQCMTLMFTLLEWFHSNSCKASKTFAISYILNRFTPKSEISYSREVLREDIIQSWGFESGYNNAPWKFLTFSFILIFSKKFLLIYSNIFSTLNSVNSELLLPSRTETEVFLRYSEKFPRILCPDILRIRRLVRLLYKYSYFSRIFSSNIEKCENWS